MSAHLEHGSDTRATGDHGDIPHSFLDQLFPVSPLAEPKPKAKRLVCGYLWVDGFFILMWKRPLPWYSRSPRGPLTSMLCPTLIASKCCKESDVVGSCRDLCICTDLGH